MCTRSDTLLVTQHPLCGKDERSELMAGCSSLNVTYHSLLQNKHTNRVFMSEACNKGHSQPRTLSLSSLKHTGSKSAHTHSLQ